MIEVVRSNKMMRQNSEPRNQSEDEKNKRSIRWTPEVTPSVLGSIPDVLRTVVADTVNHPDRKSATLVSSNSIANRCILDRWGIRPSQRNRFKQLFSLIRKHTRKVFEHYLARGWIELKLGSQSVNYRIIKFDEARGNLILKFIEITKENEWLLSRL